MRNLIIGLLVLLAAASCAVAQPRTPMEDLVARRCDALFTKGFPLFLGTDDHSDDAVANAEKDLEWLENPFFLNWVREANFTHVVLFKTYYVGYDQPIGSKTLTYRDPKRIKKFVTFAHNLNLKVLGYVAPSAATNEGWSSTDTIDRQAETVASVGLDGWYTDGVGLGNIHETNDWLTRMKNRGWIVMTHQSIQPSLGGVQEGRVDYRMPGMCTEYTLWGETNDVDGSDLDNWFKSQVAILDRCPDTIPIYKAKGGSVLSGSKTNVAKRYQLLVTYLCGVRASPKNMSLVITHYTPGYLHQKGLYEADPDDFVRKAAKRFAP